MTLRKCSAGSGLQVAFEFKRSFLRPEFDRHNQMPGTVAGAVNIQAGVVPTQSFADIGRDANVVSLGVAIAAKDVHEPPAGVSHMPRLCICRTSHVPEQK